LRPRARAAVGALTHVPLWGQYNIRSWRHVQALWSGAQSRGSLRDPPGEAGVSRRTHKLSDAADEAVVPCRDADCVHLEPAAHIPRGSGSGLDNIIWTRDMCDVIHTDVAVRRRASGRVAASPDQRRTRRGGGGCRGTAWARGVRRSARRAQPDRERAERGRTSHMTSQSSATARPRVRSARSPAGVSGETCACGVSFRLFDVPYVYHDVYVPPRVFTVYIRNGERDATGR
jgi:hypothetical protein